MAAVVSLRRVSLVALLACVALLAPSAHAADPTAQELHFWYELNRARHDPPAWAAEYGLGSVTGGDGAPVTLIGVAPRPPLALNATLVDSARFKAQELADYDYWVVGSPYGHQSGVGPTFYWPNELVRNVFGYPLATQVPDPNGGNFFYTLADDSNQIEALAAGYGPGASDYTQGLNALIGLIVDTGVPSLGHRVHLLAMSDFNTVFEEAGAGYGSNASATYVNYWTFHTGVRAAPQAWLTGVAYADGNGNSLFDPGEGLAGVTVDAGAGSAVTGATGGYSIPIAAGTHDVACSGGGFAGAASAQVAVLGFNRQVDCISGQPAAWVDFVPAPEPAALAAGGVAFATLAAASRRRGAARID
ncbi:MAG: hypothetical protein DCC71_11465 [Proteobacteria bacterium]|nr:MAG: hypothetical protein DCC71_11465 [Pseudomonadota bacterium]